jgi:hypothetical protein
MTSLRAFLLAATLLIFTLTLYVIATVGANYPAVYFSDLVKLDWRSQFSTDLLIFISLMTIWVVWREGFTPKGWLFGFLSLILGAMFACPYLLLATYQSKGDPKVLLLGARSGQSSSDALR